MTGCSWDFVLCSCSSLLNGFGLRAGRRFAALQKCVLASCHCPGTLPKPSLRLPPCLAAPGCPGSLLPSGSELAGQPDTSAGLNAAAVVPGDSERSRVLGLHAKRGRGTAARRTVRGAQLLWAERCLLKLCPSERVPWLPRKLTGSWGASGGVWPAG